MGLLCNNVRMCVHSRRGKLSSYRHFAECRCEGVVNYSSLRQETSESGCFRLTEVTPESCRDERVYVTVLDQSRVQDGSSGQSTTLQLCCRPNCSTCLCVERKQQCVFLARVTAKARPGRVLCAAETLPHQCIADSKHREHAREFRLEESRPEITLKRLQLTRWTF